MGHVPDLACTVMEVRDGQDNPAFSQYGHETTDPFLGWVEELVTRACMMARS